VPGDLLRPDGTPVQPLGLGGSTETRPQMIDRAFRLGIDYFFFYTLKFSGLVEGVSSLCRRHRQEICIATGTESRKFESLDSTLEDALLSLRTSFLDIFYLEYLAPSESFQDIERALDLVSKWKTDGRIRYIGASVHDRDLAIRTLETGMVDVLMHRYNMAHQRSEASVLPRASELGIPVVAFTCTRWGSLLKGHREWDRGVPTAGDCYRYVLRHPAVRLALTAAQSIRELSENVSILEEGSMNDAESRTWSAYGNLVYGDGTDAFETRWP